MNKSSTIIAKYIFIILTFSSYLVSQEWTQVGSDIDGEAVGDKSGVPVSISSDGTRVAIGSEFNDGTDTDAGHVRIYSESGGVWSQVGDDIDGEAADDYSGGGGESIAMSSNGKIIAIGAYGNDGTDTDAGHVRVYSESGDVWTQVGDDIDGEAAGDESGRRVSISSDGKRVAIGARLNGGKGHVRVYSESGGVWTQVGSDIDGTATDDWFGWTLALSSDGTIIAIGAVESNSEGYVRIFSELGSVWTQVGSDIDGGIAGIRSSRGLAISSDGTRVGIGAPVYNSNRGRVRIYEESIGVWTQVGSDILGEEGDGKFGWSVSMSDNGKLITAGAHLNDGAGENAGHTRVYSESSGVWTQVGSDIDGEYAGDWSGLCVSLSGDGKRVAVGARENDDGGGNAGHVRIFTKNDSPEMILKQGSYIIDTDGNYNYDRKAIGSNTDVVFTIENAGNADLTLVTPISILGANSDQFNIQSQPTSPISSGGGITTFTVRFTPSSTGIKTATISMVNNDLDENPYDLTLNGEGVQPCMNGSIIYNSQTGKLNFCQDGIWEEYLESN